MRQIKFKLRVKIMDLISFIGNIFLIGLIIGIATERLDMFIVGSIAFIVIKVLENIIWRCPKCKAKLQKVKNINTINKCSYCNYELM